MSPNANNCMHRQPLVQIFASKADDVLTNYLFFPLPYPSVVTDDKEIGECGFPLLTINGCFVGSGTAVKVNDELIEQRRVEILYEFRYVLAKIKISWYDFIICCLRK